MPYIAELLLNVSSFNTFSGLFLSLLINCYSFVFHIISIIKKVFFFADCNIRSRVIDHDLLRATTPPIIDLTTPPNKDNVVQTPTKSQPKDDTAGMRDNNSPQSENTNEIDGHKMESNLETEVPLNDHVISRPRPIPPEVSLSFKVGTISILLLVSMFCLCLIRNPQEPRLLQRRLARPGKDWKRYIYVFVCVCVCSIVFFITFKVVIWFSNTFSYI